MLQHVRILAGRLDRNAGSHVYHLELTRRLAARGHRVSVVCFEALPEVRDWAEIFEITPAPRTPGRFRWRFESWFQFRSCTRSLLSLSDPSADIVIGGEHLFLKAHRRKNPRAPLIYLPHSLVVDKEIESYDLPPIMHGVTTRVYGHLQLWALNHADCTLRFTRLGCKALASRYFASARPRFVVNPIGIDLPTPTRNAAVTNEVRLLSVGRLIHSKGIQLALTALSSMSEYNWRFDVVGDGSGREELERQARSRGIGDRVHFHGHQPDPSRWYEQADLLLFPSKIESLGLVMLEAMSYAVPCLAIRADGINFWNVNDEIIDHGKTGLLADGEADFNRQLETVLRRPERLIPLGQEARRHIAEHHTWDQHLDRYEELFEELLSEKQRRSAGVRSQRWNLRERCIGDPSHIEP